jgi:hypothetical protein
MVVHLVAGILLSTVPDFTADIFAYLAFCPEAICADFFTMPDHRLEKHTCILRIQSCKT